MREISNQQTTSRGCELATLLMVIEEFDVEANERENLISLARFVSGELAIALLEEDKGGKDA